MQLVKNIAQLQSEIAKPNKTIGLVPTMGALHLGHVSLIKRAILETDLVIVSIFVNPLQFAPTEDLDKYPEQLNLDIQICKDLGVGFIFAPTPGELGIIGTTDTQGATTMVIPPQTMTSGLCAKTRPGHFQGVATIVTKLLNIVQPDIAYFGEKDAQQLAIIQTLVGDLNLKVNIRPCATVREDSGLAYSSRNQYLTPEQKLQASNIYASLNQAAKAFSQGERQVSKIIAIAQQELAKTPEIKLEYLELVEPHTLQPLTEIKQKGLLAIAAYLGTTRLIDNIKLSARKPIIAIDGPAGAGKSTVTRQIAERLGLIYLDTGAMYRAVTWLVMEAGIASEDEAAISSLITNIDLDLIPHPYPQPTGVKINGEDVTSAIRTPQVTAKVSTIAAIASVRQKLMKLQKRLGEKGGLVAEGRDMGTNVFIDAELKIFLTASVEERAKRRLKELQQQGVINITLEALQQEIAERDYKDSTRAIAPLKQAHDAILINTDGLTIEEVTQQIYNLYYNLGNVNHNTQA